MPQRSRGSQAGSHAQTQPAPLATVIDAAAPTALVSRAARLFTRLGTQRMKEGYFTTFWLPLRTQPVHAAATAAANAFEGLALALLPHALAKAGPGAERIVGLEWWLGRSYTNRVPLGFHFDLDVKGKGAVRYPLVSSVFFFNRVRGGQLAITDQRPDARGRAVPQQPTRMEAIVPKPNRYVLFAGELFHGVLDANGHVPGKPLAVPPGRMRRTLVINYWAARPSDVPAWGESRAYRVLRERGQTSCGPGGPRPPHARRHCFPGRGDARVNSCGQS